MGHPPGEPLRIAYTLHENSAGNPLHLALMATTFGLFVSVARIRSAGLAWYAGCVLAGFILFCWLLKWQPWNSRLHLPLFLLMVPFAGVVLGRVLPRGALWAVLAVLIFWSVPYVFRNQTRPLLGENSVLRVSRSSQYFVEMPKWEAPYRNAASYPYGRCRRIGLIIGGDQWEYPLWALSRSIQPPLAIEHVNVGDPSGRLATGFVPCAIVTAPGPFVILNGSTYDRALDGPLSVFVPRLGQ